MNIGWIGVGKMGLPMAGRLLGAGHAVRAFDPAPAGPAALARQGGAVAAGIEDAARGAQVVFCSVPDDAALRAAALGEPGALAAMSPGALFVETSTVSPAASAEVARAAEARGVEYLRVAVSGNPVLAAEGTLTLLASGPRAAYDRALPLLALLGGRRFHVGEAEQARTLKLSLNLMIAVSAGMMAEALALGRRGGIDWGTMLEVMQSSAVGSPMVKYKAPPLAKRDFSSTFSCRQMIKDLDLILEAGAASGVPLAIAAQMRQMYGAAVGLGLGDEDYIATVRLVERLAGIEEEPATA